jgi:uncharacterized membrane protein
MAGQKHSLARTLLQAAAFACAIGYPLVVYLGLTRAGTRVAALGLGAVSLGLTIAGVRSGKPGTWRSAIVVPLCAAALCLDDRRYVLALPVVINAGLFALFFATLRSGVPLCERFARLTVRDLSPAEVVYCRNITKLWCVFFVVNGGTAALLATAGALEAWTLYTGLISYLLIGLVAGSEYTVRKYRFGRFGSGLHDRLLRALLPERSSTPP